MKKIGTGIMAKATVAAVATSLLMGGAQVFAAETINDGDTVRVDLNGYDTKTNYSFTPESDGDYMFSTSNVNNFRMVPEVRIYDGSTLIAEFGSGYSRVVEGMEAGRTYQVQAREVGLRQGMYGSYDLAIMNVTQVAPDYGMDECDLFIPTDDTSDENETVTDDVDLSQIEFNTESSTEVDNTPVISENETVTVVETVSESEAAPAAITVPEVIVAPAVETRVLGATHITPQEIFINRVYAEALGRIPDLTGRSFWLNQLLNQDVSASSVAVAILNSQEFTDKDLDNEEFVEILYKVFFDRTASEDEIANWTEALEIGATRSQLVNEFAASSEWNTYCVNTGIAK